MTCLNQNINALFKVPTGPLAPVKTGVSVGTLEQRLLSVFPAEDACAWDRTGLTVGNPGVEVTGVVVALDPTIAALKEATDLGANVVLTHHPVFIEAVSNFMPETVQGAKPGAVVNYALSHGINCMNFHTALDVAPQALSILPTLLRLKPRYVLDPLAGKADKGFGMVCASRRGRDLAQASRSTLGLRVRFGAARTGAIPIPCSNRSSPVVGQQTTWSISAWRMVSIA